MTAAESHLVKLPVPEIDALAVIRIPQLPEGPYDDILRGERLLQCISTEDVVRATDPPRTDKLVTVNVSEIERGLRRGLRTGGRVLGGVAWIAKKLGAPTWIVALLVIVQVLAGAVKDVKE